MQYRTYGSTGIKVSAIGFGGMRFPDQNNVELCASLMRSAYDAGINYFDTAIGYGKSEELFGAALKDMLKTRKQRPFYIATKTTAGDESSIRKEIDTSLRRLGLEFIDFYHVWCLVTPESWKERRAQGVLKAFEKLKSEGLVKNIVVSSHMAGEDIAQLLQDYPFEGILLGYSAMNFSYREVGIEAAAKLGRGVVVMNPLGGGIIPQHPEKFDFVKTRTDETVTEAAIRFLLNDNRISSILIGFSAKEQIEEAICALDGFKPISAETVEKIRSGIKSSFNEMCTGCGYCEDCPEDIPITKLMDAYNFYMLSGKPQEMLNRLNWHWWIQATDELWKKCSECGNCEAACTQHLPIMKRLKEIGTEIELITKKK